MARQTVLTSSVITSKVSEYLLHYFIFPSAPDGPIDHGQARCRVLIKAIRILVSDTLSVPAEKRWPMMI
jgi:hypothetical protein